MYKTLDDFIKHCATDKNLCFYYKDYSKEVKKLLKNIYSCYFRLNLYKSQILFMLDSAVQPFIESDLSYGAKKLLNL